MPPLDESHDQPVPPTSHAAVGGSLLRRRPIWLYALAGLGLAAILVGVYTRFRTHAKPGQGSTEERDVPHIEGSTIVFSAAYRDRAGIRFTQVERAPFLAMVRVVGTVTFNPNYVAAVGTRLRGTVRRTFKYEGDYVEANEPLAEIESAELGEAQAAIVQAKAVEGAAQTQARREKELLEKSLTTAREAEVARAGLVTAAAKLKAAEQRVSALGGNGTFGLFVLRAPISGHVVEVHLAPGQSVDANVMAYKIADLERLWIELSVFERDMGAVHLDDEVEVTPLSQPNQKIVGRVAHVGRLVDPDTHSISVRVATDNPKNRLQVGQAVQATITSREAEREALLIPRTAVLYVDGKPTVFLADGDAQSTRVRAVPVRIGGKNGVRYEVLEGVQAGQFVASAGVFALKSELFR